MCWRLLPVLPVAALALAPGGQPRAQRSEALGGCRCGPPLRLGPSGPAAAAGAARRRGSRLARGTPLPRLAHRGFQGRASLLPSLIVGAAGLAPRRKAGGSPRGGASAPLGSTHQLKAPSARLKLAVQRPSLQPSPSRQCMTPLIRPRAHSGTNRGGSLRPSSNARRVRRVGPPAGAGAALAALALAPGGQPRAKRSEALGGCRCGPPLRLGPSGPAAAAGAARRRGSRPAGRLRAGRLAPAPGGDPRSAAGAPCRCRCRPRGAGAGSRRFSAHKCIAQRITNVL